MSCSPQVATWAGPPGKGVCGVGIGFLCQVHSLCVGRLWDRRSHTSTPGVSHDRAQGWASEGLIGLPIVLKDRAWHWWDSARWGSQWLHEQRGTVGSAQPVVTLQGLGWESEQPCLQPGQLKPVGPLREVALLSVPLPTWQPCGEAWRRQTNALPDLSPAGTQQSGRQGDIPP